MRKKILLSVILLNMFQFVEAVGADSNVDYRCQMAESVYNSYR